MKDERKILFMMLHPGYMRYYYTTIRALAQRGHTIHLAFDSPDRQARDRLPEKLQQEFRGQILMERPPKIRGYWKSMSLSLVWGMDYVRYLTPEFKDADRLRKRVEVKINPAFKWMMTRLPLVNSRLGVRLVLRLLRNLYNAIPANKAVIKFINRIEPDVVLVTPLITQGTQQGEYIKAAKELGIPTAHCVASWDNLSSKGLIRGEPHRVILWNDIQKQEALELHGVAPSRVITTGAQNFDEWFERKPSTTRAEFCKKVGLDPERPFVLYMCSSNFMAPNETTVVTRWIEAIRGSSNTEVANFGILIRPYPEHVEQWKDVDLSVYENVVLWPPEGEYPVTEQAKANFYDSIYHSVAVVGINTSAMIESAIVGRPVMTVLAPELNESQVNTIHFHYMLKENGGFLQVAKDMEEHLRQLEVVMDGKEELLTQIGLFVNRFVRPHGLDVPALSMVVSTIEELCDTESMVSEGSLAGRSIRRVFVSLVGLLKSVDKYRGDRKDSKIKVKQNKKQWKHVVQKTTDDGEDVITLFNKPQKMVKKGRGGKG